MPPLYSLGVLSVKAHQEQATVVSYGNYVLLTVLEKLVQDLMLKFKYIMNAKEGFHNVLNYRGFLMFFCSKTSLFVVPTQRCWTLMEALSSTLTL